MVGVFVSDLELFGGSSSAAPVNSRVLITGAAGSGKELTARCIHEASPRAGGPFVVINAATITPENMEVELFGRERWRGEEGRRA